jgi:hypothetical protein
MVAQQTRRFDAWVVFILREGFPVLLLCHAGLFFGTEYTFQWGNYDEQR